MQEWKRERVCRGGIGMLGLQYAREYSSFLVLEESEVGGQCFILERCRHWRILLSLTAVGIVRMTR
jgi:hypothetical protein